MLIPECCSYDIPTKLSQEIEEGDLDEPLHLSLCHLMRTIDRLILSSANSITQRVSHTRKYPGNRKHPSVKNHGAEFCPTTMLVEITVEGQRAEKSRLGRRG